MNNKQHFHSPENGSLQQFSTQFNMLPGTFSPTGTFNDIYSNLLSQNSTDRGQSKSSEQGYVCPELQMWDNLKLPDKIDSMEISSKDLSPSNYYSNIDLTAPVENQYNRFEASQWSSNASNVNYAFKSVNYPSCAQVSKFYSDNKSMPYCSIQKPPENREPFKSCAYYNSSAYYNPNKQNDTPQNIYGNYTTFYDPKYPDVSTENMCFGQNTSAYGVAQKNDVNQKESFDLNYLTSLDQQTEVSNDESDIVVEDSSSDCSYEQEQQPFYETTKCLVCDTQYTPSGLQFYVLTSESPLTMSSQIPVRNKISELIGHTFSSKNYLCNDCLGLVNTIDHIQLKLDNLIKDVLNKFQISCTKNTTPKRKHNQKVKVKLRRYRCKRCKRILCVKTLLKNHVKSHIFQRYLCELCGTTVPSLKKLKVHLKKHKKPHITLIPAFTCSNKHCDKVFRTKYHLKEHENNCLGLLPFKCKNPHCNKKFASATKLKNHMKLKHEKKFIAICSICNIGFVQVSDYKSHMISHSTDKKFSCSKCDKVYKTLSNLNFHLKSHDKALPYLCTICQKGFMRKEYHEAHLNNHKGIKNFNCLVCDKKFVAQKNLDAHMKYHDGTIKSNTCNICKKIITSCFEEHLRVHTNSKEFECSACDMKFNTKNSLSKHKKRKHSKGEEIT